MTNVNTITASTSTTSTSTIVAGGFLPALNKAGKITATAEKRAALMNELDARGVQSLALNGKGAMRALAAGAIGADSLESLISSESPLSGEQIASLRAFLVSLHGEGQFNCANMRGLNGMASYLASVRLLAVARFDRAETPKAQKSALARIDTIDGQSAEVQRLIALRDAAITAANAAKTEALQASSAA